MPRLLIATTNPAKAREYREFLSDLGVEVLSLTDFGDFQAVAENSQTFEENAILKAKGYFEQFNLPTIADDGGLQIDALAGEPGVKSHRWLGREATDGELVKYALERLQGVPHEKRGAAIASTSAFYDGDNLCVESAEVRGYIVEERPDRMEEGFPWRSILFLPEFGKLMQDLTPEEHQKVNQRRKILEKLKPKIKAVLEI